MQDNTTREIPLTKGKIAIVDVEDYERVMEFKWCAFKSRTGKSWYAIRNTSLRDGQRKHLGLHTFIWGASVRLDHKNGNGLDCRKSNLREASRSQNGANRSQNKTNKSGYKGVYHRTNRWVAQIGHQGRRFILGSFHSAEDAARAYDQKAKELYGEFAYLNFPEGVT